MSGAEQEAGERRGGVRGGRPTGGLEASAGTAGLQRMHGRAAVALADGPRGARLVRLFQQGSAKALLPRVYGGLPEVVFLNTAGGLTGGDDLGYELTLGPDARAVATTQAAERAYRSLSGAARVEVSLSVGPGAVLHWLPQETILFDRAALHRRTRAELSGDARLVMAETVILGRAAMGERLAEVDLLDWREVRRDGEPVLLEPVRLTTAMLDHRTSPALLGEAVAFASLALVDLRAEERLAECRQCLHSLPDGVEAAVSALKGRLVVRALARDSFALRRLVTVCLGVLTGAPLPRVWNL